MRQHWRGCSEWRSAGLSLLTASDEAAKLYDAAGCQLAGWFSDQELGGIAGTMEKLTRADPNFVLGKTLATSFGLRMRFGFEKDNGVQELRKILAGNTDGNGVPLTSRERGHINAVLKLAAKDMRGAADSFSDILIEYPLDMVALSFAFDFNLGLGTMDRLRDVVASVYPVWMSERPVDFHFLHGMLAFGLEETGSVERAEREARRGLALEPEDGWATHTLAHVYEESGRPAEGMRFLRSTVSDWACERNNLHCHTNWHWSLHLLDAGEYDAALEHFDEYICPLALKDRRGIDIADMASLLYRMDLLLGDHGNPLASKQRWPIVMDAVRPIMTDGSEHNSTFLEAHMAMACLGANERDQLDCLMKNIPGRFRATGIIEPLIEGMVAFHEESYERAVDLLLPLRQKVFNLGGSGAQRDFYNLLLIVASSRSERKRDRSLAHRLLDERKTFRHDTSPMVDRLRAMIPSNK